MGTPDKEQKHHDYRKLHVAPSKEKKLGIVTVKKKIIIKRGGRIW